MESVRIARALRMWRFLWNNGSGENMKGKDWPIDRGSRNESV